MNGDQPLVQYSSQQVEALAKKDICDISLVDSCEANKAQNYAAKWGALQDAFSNLTDVDVVLVKFDSLSVPSLPLSASSPCRK